MVFIKSFSIVPHKRRYDETAAPDVSDLQPFSVASSGIARQHTRQPIRFSLARSQDTSTPIQSNSPHSQPPAPGADPQPLIPAEQGPPPGSSRRGSKPPKPPNPPRPRPEPPRPPLQDLLSTSEEEEFDVQPDGRWVSRGRYGKANDEESRDDARSKKPSWRRRAGGGREKAAASKKTPKQQGTKQPSDKTGPPLKGKGTGESSQQTDPLQPSQGKEGTEASQHTDRQLRSVQWTLARGDPHQTKDESRLQRDVRDPEQKPMQFGGDGSNEWDDRYMATGAASLTAGVSPAVTTTAASGATAHGTFSQRGPGRQRPSSQTEPGRGLSSRAFSNLRESVHTATRVAAREAGVLPKAKSYSRPKRDWRRAEGLSESEKEMLREKEDELRQTALESARAIEEKIVLLDVRLRAMDWIPSSAAEPQLGQIQAEGLPEWSAMVAGLETMSMEKLMMDSNARRASALRQRIRRRRAEEEVERERERWENENEMAIDDEEGMDVCGRR